MVKSVTQYFTEDGTSFNTIEEAEEHEQRVMGKVAYDVREYLNNYQGRKLLEKHTLSELGVWQIYGEDSNYCFAGSHVMPLLKTVRGTLCEALEYAVQLPRFYTLGSGGEIKQIEIVELGD